VRGGKLVQARGQDCCVTAKYRRYFLTPIATKQKCLVKTVQLNVITIVQQGCHNLNFTTKQPAVTSPAARFLPVPLTKMMMMMMTVGQANRLNNQWPFSGHAPLALRLVQYTHIQGAPEGRKAMKRHT
jgi:hypothetical protein